MRNTARPLLCLLFAMLVLMTATRAHAEPITVLCSNGLKAVMNDLVPQFERATGHHVLVSFSVSAELGKRIAAGESFDVAVLTPGLIDDLGGRGLIAIRSRSVIARSGMALAVRRGAPVPRLDSVGELKAALLATPSIAFAREGTGGVFFNALIARLGIAEQLRPTFRPVVTGDDVSRAVANGDAVLGVLPVSEILSAPGVTLAGLFPREVQEYAVMVGAIGTAAKAAAPAQALLTFLMSDSSTIVVRARGMERMP